MGRRQFEIPPADVLAERVFARVDASGPCWLWAGAVNKARGGYGVFGVTVSGKGSTWWVHRWVYEYLVGPIPEGLMLDHLCREPRCCNPDHLEPVTNRENCWRGFAPNLVKAKERARQGLPPVDPRAVYVA